MLLPNDKVHVLADMFDIDASRLWDACEVVQEVPNPADPSEFGCGDYFKVRRLSDGREHVVHSDFIFPTDEL